MSTVISVNDGFSALIHYNKKCSRNLSKTEMNFSVDQACMNIIYDMNGLKGPNHVGEDIGIVTVFWSGLKTVATAPGIIPYSVNTTEPVYATFAEAPGVCMQKTNKIHYSVPDIDEISSLYINQQLTSLPRDFYWSGFTVTDRPTHAWFIYDIGYRDLYWRTGKNRVWCVRR